jgi:hypothetical protein
MSFGTWGIGVWITSPNQVSLREAETRPERRIVAVRMQNQVRFHS